jgi:hypothetical protein
VKQAKGKWTVVFEQYRSIILRDHFERTHGLSGITQSPRHDSRG